MNELTKFLVESILNETTEKVVALFGGGFKPPTKGHLDVVNQGIKQNPEVSEVKILVGGGERNGFTQDQAVKIWNLYNDVGFIKKPATIIPVSSPFTYYKNYLKDNPDDKVYVFIGSRPDDEKDQMDVKQRSEFVKKYSDNVIPVEISTGGGVSGTLARKLFKTNIDGFRNMFPENLLDQDFKKILDILNNKSTGNTQKSAPKSTEPLTPQNENLILERIKLTPDEVKLSNEVLKRAKKIFQRGTRSKQSREGVAVMPFTSADGKPGKVSFYVDHNMSPGNLGYYNKKKINDLEDDIIVLNGPFFTSAYSAIKDFVFSKVTGENPDKFLLDTIKHELIHAKDPGVNQEHLKEPYDSKNPKLYYGSWTEFPAQTGEFLEAISAHAEEKLRNNPNDKEIQIFERILQNILDVYAGKEKAFYNKTKDFIVGGSKKNVVQSFIKDVISIGGEISNRNTVPQWDSMNTLQRYYNKTQLIKKYNPEGYKEFLTDLYKEIKGIEKMTNFYLKEKAKALGQTKYSQIYVGGTGKLNEGDPKKGTGKKPKGSKRRLYTDEDPKDTVGIKFSTRQDIVDTLNKKSFKAKSHARQSQIINLIHQRVRAAYGRAKDPAVKKRLKTGLDYITDKKEASKKKTQRLKKKKLNEDILDQTSLVLPRGKKIYLQAEEEDYNRGLIVELTEEGGYKMNYWYGEDAKVYPVEVLVDGEEIKPDAREVYMKFHPELEKENIDPSAQKKHKGKSAPFGSAYKPVEEGLVDDIKQGLKSLGAKTLDFIEDFGKVVANVLNIKINKPEWAYDWEDYYKTIQDAPGLDWPGDEDDEYALAVRLATLNDKKREKLLQQGKITKEEFEEEMEDFNPTPTDRNIGFSQEMLYVVGDPLTRGKRLKDREKFFTLNENATYSSKIDYKQQIKDLTKHMIKKGMNILPLPRVIFKHGDQENASQFLGKTAYYSPSDMTVVLYTEGRHPKDIVRSFAHEMVHHIQNLEGRLGGINTTNTQEDDNLNDIEREAYTKGNMTFRNWTDSLDGEEVTSLNEKIVGEKIECDNCGWSWNIVDGGDDLFICHKCGYDNEPENGDPFGLKAYARELMEDFNIKDIKPATKSLEEQERVRIFNPNCGCDKT